MKVEYKIKPRVKLYFFGLFSRVVYDLVRESDDYDSEIKSTVPWRQTIKTYKDLELAEKGLQTALELI